jgi:hypothetical protein
MKCIEWADRKLASAVFDSMAGSVVVVVEPTDSHPERDDDHQVSWVMVLRMGSIASRFDDVAAHMHAVAGT